MHSDYVPALRSLDAAVGTLDEDHRQRADVLLERIVATPVGRAPARTPGRMRRGLVWASAATAIAVAITVGSSALQGTRDAGVAYASWTATPSAATAHDLDTVVGACRDQLQTGDELRGVDYTAIPVTLAERRGDFVAVLFHQGKPDISASCVAYNRPGSTRVDDVHTGVGGSSGPAWMPPPGRISQGPIAQYRGAQPAAFTDGALGRGVVGVTIHAGTQTVVASVENGRYAAWWPGKAFPDGPSPASGRHGALPSLTYDVHLSDGRVKTNVDPALPR
jgi:hypothetical protein